MSVSKIWHEIKGRETPNDVFITPIEVSKKHISMIDEKYKHDIWFDPFKNTGSYYNNFPETCQKKWTEILEDKDFFLFNEKVDVICSNPPFSVINDVLKKCIELQPTVIALLFGAINLSPKRMKLMEDNGYYLTKIHKTRVKKWFSYSLLLVWEKNKQPIMSFDTIYHA
jgi:hypothetical protein